MKITFNSPLILAFSFACVVIYIFQHYFGMFQNAFALSPNWNSRSFMSYFKMVSHTMGHANLEHLIGNLSFVLLIGPIVEKQYGYKFLIFMMIITALVTSVFQLTFFSNGLMGASGIVFMLIILTSMANIKNKEIPLTFILVAIIFIGKEVLGSFNNDNISHSAHIIGGVMGAIFGFAVAGKTYDPKHKEKLKGRDILKDL